MVATCCSIKISQSGIQKLLRLVLENPTGYIVTIYDEENGVDTNENWFFMRKKNQFYFYLFTAEAG
jgi:hypothetical protein